MYNDKQRKQYVTELPSVLEHVEGVGPVIGEEANLHQDQLQLDYLCAELVNPKFKEPFSLRRKWGHLSVDITSLGKRLLHCLKIVEAQCLNKQVEQYSPNVFCPNIKVVTDILGQAFNHNRKDTESALIQPLSFPPDELKLLLDEELGPAVNALNNLARILRQNLMTQALREQVKSFRRNAKDICKHAKTVIRQAVNDHNKVLFARLDFGCMKRYPVVPTSFISEEEFEQQLVEIDAYKNLTLNWLKKKFGEDLLFYCWKIECGEIKGLHVHWLIGLNGSKYQDRINVPYLICKSIDKEIDRSDMYTFNVNALDKTGYSGLRVMNYHDPELPEVIDRYCDYLTKVDYTIKLRLPSSLRSFGCSHKKKAKNKRGPKRQYQMNLSLFKAEGNDMKKEEVQRAHD